MAIAFDPDLKVSELLKLHPNVLEVLVRCGFTPLKVPAVRSVMANAVTLREACEKREISLEVVLERLKTECGEAA